MHRRRASLWIVLLATVLGACGPAVDPPPPRLVVLLATCTLRRDFLGPWDPAVRYTPNLDALAAGSQVFLRHETEAGQSGTDFAALFTGVQAGQHGVFRHPKVLREGLQLIGEAFADAGYETWFLNGHRMAAIDLAYGQGIPPERSLDIRGQRKRNLTGEGFGPILASLSKDPAKRAFVQANFTVTHAPYSKQVTREQVLEFVRLFPEHGQDVTGAELDRWWPLYLEERLALEWDLEATAQRLGLSEADVAELARVLEVTYRAAVHGLDALVGGLIDAIRAAGLWEDTLFAFTADHGEIQYRPGTPFHWNHGLQLAPEILDVPWILHGPRQGVGAGRQAGVTRSIDVFPTLAGLAGIPTGAKTEGADLAPALRGEAPFPKLRAFSHTTVVSPEDLETFHDFAPLMRLYPRTDPELCWVRVREDDLVVQRVHQGEGRWAWQTFDLERDPFEAHDLFDPNDPRQTELRQELEAYQARLVEGYRLWAEDGELGREQSLERLRDLGYAR